MSCDLLEWYEYGTRCVLGCWFNLAVSSQIPAFLLAPGVTHEGLAAKCLRLWLVFSFLTFGDYLPLIEYWRVARGFDFPDASPYSPIPDSGSRSSANHQLSIFTSSCFMMWKQFSQQLKNTKLESIERVVLIKEPSWKEHGRGEQSSTNCFVSAERNEWAAPVEYPRILCIC